MKKENEMVEKERERERVLRKIKNNSPSEHFSKEIWTEIEKKRGREIVCVYMCVYVRVCVCVCERKVYMREREKKKEG